MLTNEEQMLIRKFLKDFPSEDLFILAESISQKNLSPSSIEDALCIICQHSECIQSILEKRKITKSFLSQYLHKNKVSIINSWDKASLIRKTLDFWNINKPQSFIKDSVPHNENIQNVNEEQNSTDYFKQLSYEFSNWYYSLLNDEDSSKMGPEHFFVDSQIKLALHGENCTDVVEASNSTSVVETLRDIKLKYNLKFLPNLTPNAIKYECDIHGQVMLMVNGTLHSNTTQVVGVFEQIFLLIRDISDNNNWKIKRSQIVLRSMNSSIENSIQNPLSICS